MRPILFSFSLLFVLIACDNVNNYSEVPQVEFLSVEVCDTIDQTWGNPQKSVYLSFYLTDGDGDIGNPEENMIDESTSELHLTTYMQKDGQLQLVEDTIERYKSYMLPYYESDVHNKVLKAKVSAEVFYFYSPQLPLPFDTICYVFYVTDRSGNLSNSDTTAFFILSQDSIYKD